MKNVTELILEPLSEKLPRPLLPRLLLHLEGEKDHNQLIGHIAEFVA